MSERVPRAPLQVLVLPFRVLTGGALEFAVFRRSNFPDECWQGIAGGADNGETAEQAARLNGPARRTAHLEPSAG